ncbi:MAG: DegT/DnrJ/EryC1/StrS family aminotransferase [Candidatus Omnitrophica bacterium]|nr:DegT/DnrJ/EryC1/StrS family aminotransferase [Candidatus Omnitrophota bacterium]
MTKTKKSNQTKDFIPIANTFIGPEEAKAVYEVIRSGWISMGKKVEEFEAMAADYLGTKYAVAFNNGTATLHASLLAVGVKENDEVLVPTLSYISSANAVLYCGAIPKFCQEDAKTFNVTADEIERNITPRTRAIMTVDLKGMPVDFDAIKAVAQKHRIPIVSDSAESFGALYKGRQVASQCEVHSFSFFANKNITTGEGGLISTNDPEINRIVRIVRNQGQSERYKHVMIGHNYRMTDMVAAFGIEQLRRVEWIMEEKNRVADFYHKAFASHPLIQVPYVPDYVTRHSWYMYCLTFAKNVDRDAVIQRMKEDGVDSRLSFPLIPLQPIYREKFGYKDGDFPASEAIFASFVDIPCWPKMTKKQMQKVVDVVITAVEASHR